MKHRVRPLGRHGFTLTELIVSIVILAVLSTIGFIATQGYSSRSRDSNRTASLHVVQLGLERYAIESGYFPDPESPVLTGSINGITYTNRGYVKSDIARKIDIDKPPLDPLSGTEYVYAVSSPDKKRYQIAGLFENPVAASEPLLVNTANANANQRAKVSGNYPGYFKYMSGSSQYLVNVPSLIFSNTGSIDLLSSGTNYVVDTGTNLPYSVSSTTYIAPSAPNQVVRFVTGKSDATLMTVDITSVTAQNIGTYFSGSTLSSFGGNLNQVSLMIFDGKNTGSGAVALSCSAGSYSNGISCVQCPANSWCAAGVTSPTACTGGMTSPAGSTSSAACVSAASNPTALALSHSANWIAFNVSWTAGSGNGGAGGCKLQFQNGGSWVDITSASSLNCDANLSNSFSLNANGWKSNWGGTAIRVVRVGSGTVLGTFPQTLNCSGMSASMTQTSNTDEGCDGSWDDSYTTDVNCSTPANCGGNSYAFYNENADAGDPYSCPSSITYRGQTVSYTGLQCEVPIYTYSDASCTVSLGGTPSVRGFQSALSGTIASTITSGWPTFVGTSISDATCRVYAGSYAKSGGGRWGWGCYCNYGATFYN